MKLAPVQVFSCKHPLSCHPLLSPQFLDFLVAPVVEKVDSAIVWVNLYQVDSAVIAFHNTYIHWIAIYPVDGAIQHLNSWGLLVRSLSNFKTLFFSQYVALCSFQIL